ncbi:DNA polymerase III subunit psi [Orbaceae bacterium ESL0721]|nr:DNA polymerase III subunit psi [Orbaceae bacterium ESL0721]
MRQQDWYLTQCNITQYILRKSAVQKSERLLELNETVKLIVVASQKPVEKIFYDILSAIHLNEDQVFHLTPAQLMIAEDNVNRVVWFIDVALPDSWQNSCTIKTCNLAQLASSPAEKRKLWQQLCHYQNLFQ